MTGISIETTLELWASSLRAVKARMAPLFTQERVAASAGLFLDGLLGGERRKTCPFRKFHPTWNRIERQNHHIIDSDVCDPACVRNVRRRPVQVAVSA